MSVILRVSVSLAIAIAIVCQLAIYQPARAGGVRFEPELAPIWTMLDAARAYRKNFRDPSAPQEPYGKLIEAYNKPVDSFDTCEPFAPPCTPAKLFLKTIEEFSDWRDRAGRHTALGEEATWGVQEALNEYMAGQLLVGNDHLFRGLGARIELASGTASQVPSDDEPYLAELAAAAAAFEKAIDAAAEVLQEAPHGLRAGDGSAEFPFWVENSSQPGEDGELVESELYRLAHLLERAAMARHEKSRRIFFFGNFVDAERQAAAEQLQRSAHAAYLHSAVLAAVQTEGQFQQNNGYRLKAEIRTAQRMTDDIAAGLGPLDVSTGPNPLRVRGDFVPYQGGQYGESVVKLFGLARDEVIEAEKKEQSAKGAKRLYDQDQTALATTLRQLREGYVDEIARLTGFAAQGGDNPFPEYELSDTDNRKKLFEDAKEGKGGEVGYIRQQTQTLERARRAVEHAFLNIKWIVKDYREESGRTQTTSEDTIGVSTIIKGPGTSSNAECPQEAMVRDDESLWLDCTSGPGEQCEIAKVRDFLEAILSSFTELEEGGGVSFEPVEPLQGHVEDALGIYEGLERFEVVPACRSGEMGTLRSAANAAIALENNQKTLEAEQARLDQYQAELERVIGNYLVAREDQTQAYFSDPAYRIERDTAVVEAEHSFEAAMKHAYRTAKALEYLWSENFSNPILTPGQAPVPVNGQEGAPFTLAESVYAAKSASGLDAFLDTLRAWDDQMRDIRGPGLQVSSVVISLRVDVLGFTGQDENRNQLLFRDHIARNRVPGLNANNQDLRFDFQLQIADQSIFPAHPNIKIRDISIDLLSSPARSIAGPGTTSAPAKVDLIMGGVSSVRSFLADYPDNDDVLTYDLPDLKRFTATVDATIDGWSNPTPDLNTPLGGHSPATTRWTIWLDMDKRENRYLQLEYLEDLTMTLKYLSGVPPLLQF